MHKQYGARGMALMGCDIKDLAGLRVGVIGDDRVGSDVNAALSNMIRVDVAAARTLVGVASSTANSWATQRSMSASEMSSLSQSTSSASSAQPRPASPRRSSQETPRRTARPPRCAARVEDEAVLDSKAKMMTLRP
jgi:hypothetical protein